MEDDDIKAWRYHCRFDLTEIIRNKKYFNKNKTRGENEGPQYRISDPGSNSATFLPLYWVSPSMKRVKLKLILGLNWKNIIKT